MRWFYPHPSPDNIFSPSVMAGFYCRHNQPASGAQPIYFCHVVSPAALGQGAAPLSSSVIQPLTTWSSLGRHGYTKVASDDLDMKEALFALLVIASATPSALAQKEIPKASGHDQCPLGYLNTLGTTCVSPIYYEVAPTNGKACKSGWMNIGAGYCKKKTLGIF